MCVSVCVWGGVSRGFAAGACQERSLKVRASAARTAAAGTTPARLPVPASFASLRRGAGAPAPAFPGSWVHDGVFVWCSCEVPATHSSGLESLGVFNTGASRGNTCKTRGGQTRKGSPSLPCGEAMRDDGLPLVMRRRINLTLGKRGSGGGWVGCVCGVCGINNLLPFPQSFLRALVLDPLWNGAAGLWGSP